MNIKIKRHWSDVVDFLISNLVIALALTYRDSLIGILSSPYLPYFIDAPKSYTAFIEGLMAGLLIGVYVFFKNKINILAMVFGMWLYPLVKYISFRPLNDMESWLLYLSELSMFIGIFCILFYLASIAKKAKWKSNKE